jgi:hypothetical protein
MFNAIHYSFQALVYRHVFRRQLRLRGCTKQRTCQLISAVLSVQCSVSTACTCCLDLIKFLTLISAVFGTKSVIRKTFYHNLYSFLFTYTSYAKANENVVVVTWLHKKIKTQEHPRLTLATWRLTNERPGDFSRNSKSFITITQVNLTGHKSATIATMTWCIDCFSNILEI